MGTEWSLHKVNSSDFYEELPLCVPPSEVAFLLLPPTIYYRKSVKQSGVIQCLLSDTIQLCRPNSGGRYCNSFLTETS